MQQRSRRRPLLFLLSILHFFVLPILLKDVTGSSLGRTYNSAMVVSRVPTKKNHNSQQQQQQQQQQAASKRSSSSSATIVTLQPKGPKKRALKNTIDHHRHSKKKELLAQTNKPNKNSQQRQQQAITATTTTTTTTTTTWRTASTTGEAIQLATSISDLLEIASTLLWLPTDPNLPIHYYKQSIHHDRRQRWSAQLLCKLGDLMMMTMTDTTTTAIHEESSIQQPSNHRWIWQDERLARAVLAAAYPFVTIENDLNNTNNPNNGVMTRIGHHDTRSLTSNYQTDSSSNRGKSVRVALMGLAKLAGKVPLLPKAIKAAGQSSSDNDDDDNNSIHPDIVHGIRILLARAEAMADDHQAWPLNEICEMRWASRGILMRLGLSHTIFPTDAEEVSMTMTSTTTTPSSHEQLAMLLPRMQDRVNHLPFDILPMGVPEWSNPVHHRDIMDRLQREIPFFFDTITTRQGSSVTERRGTAWVTEPGIGALAYSGKLMPPTSPLPNIVQSTMRLVEAAVVGMPRNFFDCALCNFYPSGDAACQFHTDPEHGTMWERSSCVVAMGDQRRFAFRPIPRLSTWPAWDSRRSPQLHHPNQRISSSSSSSISQPPDDVNNTPAVANLFAGDIVHMWGTCNDDFHHAVYPGDYSGSNTEACFGRISLVLKRAMIHKGQRRGHGLPGEGRKSRRQLSK